MSQENPWLNDPVHVAESVKKVLMFEHPLAKALMDRRVPLTEELIAAVLQYSVFSWEGRNPAPALDMQGNLQGTDLDLLSLLVPLAQRKAIIEVPEYTNRRPIRKREGERKIGENRFGRICELISNRNVFSFSMRIEDQTSLGTCADESEKMGLSRCLMLVDINGELRLVELSFKPTAHENRFLTAHGLYADGVIAIKYAVHPNRYQSIYGAPYLLTVLALRRLNDEGRYWKGEWKRLEEKGIFPPQKRRYPKTEQTGPSTRVLMPTMLVEFDLPKLQGSYRGPEGDTEERAQYAYDRQRILLHILRKPLSFVKRADEFAFFRYGGVQQGRILRAPWAQNLLVEEGYIAGRKRRRHSWNRLRYFDDIAMRFRTTEWEETIADDLDQ